MTDPLEDLTRKQQIFVKEYIETGNGTQSALKAYDTDSIRTAAVIASENLTKPEIKDAIKSIADSLPDNDLIQKHKELLNASTLEHMSFSTGPKNEEQKVKIIEAAKAKALAEGKEYKEVEHVTDEDIVAMFKEVNCTVKRIVHRETARDVYFWSSDNMARDKALDKAYKLKGSYAAEKSITLNLDAEVTPELLAKAQAFDEYFKKQL